VLDQRGRLLFDALWVFYEEHEYCGHFDGGVEGGRVWMTGTRGVVFERWVMPEDAELDLLWAAKLN
jgi:hypothetical protein